MDDDKTCCESTVATLKEIGIMVNGFSLAGKPLSAVMHG
ncbi:hypothetical protein LEA_07477, partial [human gut metagenome]